MLGAIADLVAPKTCAGCGVRGEALCEACRDELRGSPLRVRLRADVPVPVFACGRYGGTSQAVINAYKEQGRAELARDLGDAAARLLWGLIDLGEIPEPHDTPLAFVTAPASAAATRRRGFDHVARWAERTTRVLSASLPPGSVVMTQPLKVRGRVRDAAGLSAGARAENLAGRIVAAPPRILGGDDPAKVWAQMRGGERHVVLLDDVVTTGATMAECVRALDRIGLRSGSAVALRAA